MFRSFRHFFVVLKNSHSGPENFKKFRPKKLVKSMQINQFYEFSIKMKILPSENIIQKTKTSMKLTT